MPHGIGSYCGMAVYVNEFMPPDWYLIGDWNNPQKTAVPQYDTVWIVDGNYMMHPALLKRLQELSDERVDR